MNLLLAKEENWLSFKNRGRKNEAAGK